eukprot:TRINITY_DN22798_c0_g1_i1.p1 TRINITY_DN22798_c0_g1~~TRINITY_DN22798_c0_g1_i1.p1  ORF type:complete len:496 (+),score=79.37 TRINITY_DN22798_c0_g1_i1:56-1543(+)
MLGRLLSRGVKRCARPLLGRAYSCSGASRLVPGRVACVTSDVLRRGTGGHARAFSSDEQGSASADSDAVTAFEQILNDAEAREIAAEDALAEPGAEALLGELVDGMGALGPQRLRALLVALARAQCLPEALWPSLAEALAQALDELPDLHVVHVALLLSQLAPRDRGLHSPLLLQELAEQLEHRADSLPPMGRTGALVALSQLGPWPDPQPGEGIAETMIDSLSDLRLNELSASALAAATLGVESARFWQMMHGALLQRIDDFSGHHLADVLLALATAQRLPIALLEACQDRLRGICRDMSPSEALTAAWALCAMQLYPKASLATTCAVALSDDLSPARATRRQLLQVAFELRKETRASAVHAAAMENQGWMELEPDASGADCEPARGACSATSELLELLSTTDAECSLNEAAQGNLYRLDLVVRPPGRQPVVVIFDDASASGASSPQDPWIALKRRHLRFLGWDRVEWLATRRWNAWSEEERHEFVSHLTSTTA